MINTNILIFGPNGSGKGTQGKIIKEKYGLPHIETGVIFRENISNGTTLGLEAKKHIDKGELVPDSITVPMVLKRLKEPDAGDGWLLDGYPRNLNQAIKLDKALGDAEISLDIVIEIILERGLAKNRIMGRRLCVNDNNHPNNIFINAIKPKEGVCRVCGSELKTRADDVDIRAIGKRHDIYYDSVDGTLAAVNFFKEMSEKKGAPTIIELDGSPGVEKVSAELLSKIEG